MANLERNYVVPLRQYWRMAPRYKRAKRAVNGLRRFVIRHMKVDEVKIGKELNDFILERGQRKPPARVQVTIVKEDMIGKVNIMGVPYSKEVKEEKKSLLGKVLRKEKTEAKEEKSSLKKTSEKTEEKLLEKAESKEEKHEHKEKSSLEQPFEKSLGKNILEKTEEKKGHEAKKKEKPKVKKAVKKKEIVENKEEN